MADKNTNQKVAIILLRGLIGISGEIKDTLFMLKLRRKHACVVYDLNPSVHGMIKKIKDYVTWGIINDETYKLLVEKRGKKVADSEEISNHFALHPARGGFERKGTKVPYTIGGSLGDRKAAINDLIKRMI